MSNVSAALVKELREKTGAGMMDCKKALESNNGDLEAAVDFLRKKGLADAAKKAGRIASEGLVVVKSEGSSVAMVEVNCETDFVAKTDGFINLCDELSGLVLEKNPASAEELLGLDKSGKKVSDYLAEQVATIGENIQLRRLGLLEANEGGVAGGYVHAGGKIGVIVKLDCEGFDSSKLPEDLTKDIAMHICASSPLAISEADVDPDVVEREKKVYTEKARESGKPEDMIEKIVAGQVNKFLSSSALLNQGYVKDPDLTVKKFLDETGKSLGGKINVASFTRFELGEGLEKRKDDFVEEVRKQAGL